MLTELLVRLGKFQPHTADHNVVGKLVRVTDRIEPGRLGAVLVQVRGGTEEFYARTAAQVAMPAGQMVRVIAYAPPRTVEVEPAEQVTLSKHPTPEF